MIAPRINYTAAKALEQCTRRYAWSFLAFKPVFQPALHLGQAVHNIAARASDVFHRTGKFLDDAELAPMLRTELDQLPPTETPVSRYELEQLLDEGIPKLQIFLRDVLPKLRGMKRLETERWVRVELHNESKFVIATGKIDLLFYDPTGQRFVILDLKTGRACDDLGSNPQLALYISAIRADTALQAEFGAETPVVACNVYLEQPKATFVKYDAETHLQTDLKYLVRAGIRAYDLTEFPAQPNSGCAYCPFFEACFPNQSLEPPGVENRQEN
jgi:CRISPR/Cas system-associated exonuclease Cas4 (RecB family)